MTADNARHRLGILAVCALSLFGALFARLWFLQVVEADALAAQVSQNSTRTVVITAPRGRILDTNGIALVENRESIVVSIDGQALREQSEEEQAGELERIATSMSRFRSPDEAVTVEFLKKRLNDQRFSAFRPVPIAEDVGIEEEIWLREQADRFPSLVVERQTVRSYPYGSLAAHVLGYVGAITEEEWEARKTSMPDKPYEKSDEIGKAGVERTYEEYLRGRPGKRVYEISRTGKVVRELLDERVDPAPGDDVYLSIDARIQYKTEEALQAQILASESPTPYGAATVLDPRNGQVIAMASYPTYDPSTLVGGISQDEYDQLTAAPAKILSNRNIQEAYPAASTFKLASSYAGYKLGIIDPDEYVLDTGSYRLCPGSGSGCLKKNSGNKEYGSINLATALTVSSDVYAYRIGDIAWSRREELGDDALQQKIEELGYGQKTGIDLTAESAGLIPTPASNAAIAETLWEKSPENYDNDPEKYEDAKLWRGGNSADLAIGQGSVGVTPLQTANAYAALANPQNIQYQPSVLQVVTSAQDPDTIRKPYVAEELRRVDFGTAKQAFLDGFAGVVNSSKPRGTAYSVFQTFPFSESFPQLSGKTGTAEVGDDTAQKEDNSLFVAYGPNPDNEFVVSVMIQGGGFGGEAAAPAAYMILEPIADGSIESFEIPKGGSIDAESAADGAGDISTAVDD